ncbi:uncharacterized protein [Branchiostoma lanceolatum]|uniref:uncharacterized protein n=1 Tax=Branchiostoma lanceolatum TaxID=7740 RepID=UPI00345231FE
MLRRLFFCLHLLVITFFQISANMEWDCKLCDPGYFLVSPCANGLPNSTLCEMCKGRSFTPTYNNETSCIKCREPNQVVYSDEDTPIACRCAKGFHKKHSTCVRNTFCRPGKGVHRGGCLDCPEGQFSNTYSNTQHCRPWTNCSARGMVTLSEGTSRRDAICKDTSVARGRRRHNRKRTEGVREMVTNATKVQAKNAEKRILRQKGLSSTSSIELTSTKNTTTTTSMPITTSDQRISHAKLLPTVPGDDPSYWFFIVITASVITLLLLVITMLMCFCYRGLIKRTSKRKATCKAKEEIGEVEKTHPVLMSDESLQGEYEVSTNPKEIEEHRHANQPPPYHSQDFQPMSTSHFSINSRENWNHISGHYSDLNQDYEEEETSPKSHIPLGFSVSMEFANTAHAPSTESLTSTDISSASWQTSPSSVAYRKRIQERLAQAVTNVLSRSAMEHLVGGLGREWQALAQRLGLTEAEIDHILNENRSDLDKQIYEMIRKWQQGKTGQASISELYGALLECNMEELHNKIVSLEGPAGCQNEPMKDVL